MYVSVGLLIVAIVTYLPIQSIALTLPRSSSLRLPIHTYCIPSQFKYDSYSNTHSNRMHTSQVSYRTPPQHMKKHVLCFQVLSAIILGLFICNFNIIESSLHSVYSNLRIQPFFQHFSFEPLLSSFCFFLYTQIFAILDLFGPNWIRSHRILNSDSNDAWSHRLKDGFSQEGFWYIHSHIILSRLLKNQI